MAGRHVGAFPCACAASKSDQNRPEDRSGGERRGHGAPVHGKGKQQGANASRAGKDSLRHWRQNAPACGCSRRRAGTLRAASITWRRGSRWYPMLVAPACAAGSPAASTTGTAATSPLASAVCWARRRRHHHALHRPSWYDMRAAVESTTRTDMRPTMPMRTRSSEQPAVSPLLPLSTREDRRNRYAPTASLRILAWRYQHRSPECSETGKRHRGYVYPKRNGCGEYCFTGASPCWSRASANLSGSIPALGGKVAGVSRFRPGGLF